MLIYEIDVDGTICETKGTDYEHSKPKFDVIAKVNRAYLSGAYIRISTARGSKTGLDWTGLTKQQLIRWGVKHHELLMKRPYADKIINDKAVNVKDWLLQLN